MTALLYIIGGFFAGSLMFSLWLGKARGVDIRHYGDGNPGATNMMIAQGKVWGIAAMLLDGFKGLIPVFLAKFISGIEGVPLVAVALAPVLGHAFSPWLGFRGGKAVAVTFGIWTGLTIWEAPTVLGIGLGLGFALIAVSGWALMLAQTWLLAYWLLTNPDPVYLAVWVLTTALLAYKYRDDLRRFPAPRPWLEARLAWRSA